MKLLRRSVTMTAASLLSVAAFVLAAPQAFAVRLYPGSSGPIGRTAPVAHQGLTGWEIAFITLAAVVFLAGIAALVRLRVIWMRRPVAA